MCLLTSNLGEGGGQEMSVREILLYPKYEAALRKKSEPVGVVNRQVRERTTSLRCHLITTGKTIHSC